MCGVCREGQAGPDPFATESFSEFNDSGPVVGKLVTLEDGWVALSQGLRLTGNHGAGQAWRERVTCPEGVQEGPQEPQRQPVCAGALGARAISPLWAELPEGAPVAQRSVACRSSELAVRSPG